MNVIVSCGGKFHSFSLVEQLARKKVLHSFYTTYFNKKTNAKDYKIPKKKVKTFILPKLILYTSLRVFRNKSADLYYITAKQFGNWVAKKLVDADIFVSWSGYALEPFEEAKKRGMINILERGSVHIIEQNNLLKDEYEKIGIHYNEINKKMIERELMEYDKAEYIFIPSTFAKKSFIKHGIPEERLIQIPYGVYLNKFYCTEKKRNDKFIITQVGCSIQKGTHYLIQAFQELKLKNSELYLVGHMPKELYPFLNKYNSNNIKIFGNIDIGKLIKIYSKSSVFVLPSIQDGFGMVILEAMACGLPVICTENTAGGDIVENGKEGFVIQAGDIDLLKEKLLYFYDNRELLRIFGTSAKQKAKQFTWDIYGEKIYSSYINILKNNEIF